MKLGDVRISGVKLPDFIMTVESLVVIGAACVGLVFWVRGKKAKLPSAVLGENRYLIGAMSQAKR